VVSFVMSQKMLRGIRDRAEYAAVLQGEPGTEPVLGAGAG
jgi:hypothetical protein